MAASSSTITVNGFAVSKPQKIVYSKRGQLVTERVRYFTFKQNETFDFEKLNDINRAIRKSKSHEKLILKLDTIYNAVGAIWIHDKTFSERIAPKLIGVIKRAASNAAIDTTDDEKLRKKLIDQSMVIFLRKRNFETFRNGLRSSKDQTRVFSSNFFKYLVEEFQLKAIRSVFDVIKRSEYASRFFGIEHAKTNTILPESLMEAIMDFYITIPSNPIKILVFNGNIMTNVAFNRLADMFNSFNNAELYILAFVKNTADVFLGDIGRFIATNPRIYNLVVDNSNIEYSVMRSFYNNFMYETEQRMKHMRHHIPQSGYIAEDYHEKNTRKINTHIEMISMEKCNICSDSLILLMNLIRKTNINRINLSMNRLEYKDDYTEEISTDGLYQLFKKSNQFREIMVAHMNIVYENIANDFAHLVSNFLINNDQIEMLDISHFHYIIDRQEVDGVDVIVRQPIPLAVSTILRALLPTDVNGKVVTSNLQFLIIVNNQIDIFNDPFYSLMMKIISQNKKLKKIHLYDNVMRNLYSFHNLMYTRQIAFYNNTLVKFNIEGKRFLIKDEETGELTRVDTLEEFYLGREENRASLSNSDLRQRAFIICRARLMFLNRNRRLPIEKPRVASLIDLIKLSLIKGGELEEKVHSKYEKEITPRYMITDFAKYTRVVGISMFDFSLYDIFLDDAFIIAYFNAFPKYISRYTVNIFIKQIDQPEFFINNSRLEYETEVLTEKWVNTFIETFKRHDLNEYINHLHLGRMQLSEDDIIRIVKTLHPDNEPNRIQRFGLVSNPTFNRSLYAYSNFLKNMPILKQISFQIGDDNSDNYNQYMDGSVDVFHALSEHEFIEDVLLSGRSCFLNNRLTNRFTEMMINTQSITSLTLFGTLIDESVDIDMLFSFLSAPKSVLKELILEKTEIKRISPIAHRLIGNKSLTKLNIFEASENHVYEDFKEFVDIFSDHYNSIQVIDITPLFDDQQEDMLRLMDAVNKNIEYEQEQQKEQLEEIERLRAELDQEIQAAQSTLAEMQATQNVHSDAKFHLTAATDDPKKPAYKYIMNSTMDTLYRMQQNDPKLVEASFSYNITLKANQHELNSIFRDMHNTHLKKLYLTGLGMFNQFTPSFIFMEISSVIKRGDLKLDKLSLKDNGSIGNNPIVYALSDIIKYGNIKSLNFSQCGFDYVHDLNVDFFTRALAENKSIKSLNLSECKSFGIYLPHIMNALLKAGVIEKLKISSIPLPIFNKACAFALYNIIRTLPNFYYLDIGGTLYESALGNDLGHFSMALYESKNLRILNLSYPSFKNDYVNENRSRLVSSIVENPNRLYEELYLNNFYITQEETVKLVYGFYNFVNTLKVLDFKGVSLTPVVAEGLKKLLSETTVLTEFKTSITNISLYMQRDGSYEERENRHDACMNLILDGLIASKNENLDILELSIFLFNNMNTIIKLFNFLEHNETIGKFIFDNSTDRINFHSPLWNDAKQSIISFLSNNKTMRFLSIKDVVLFNDATLVECIQTIVEKNYMLIDVKISSFYSSYLIGLSKGEYDLSLNALHEALDRNKKNIEHRGSVNMLSNLFNHFIEEDIRDLIVMNYTPILQNDIVNIQSMIDRISRLNILMTMSIEKLKSLLYLKVWSNDSKDTRKSEDPSSSNFSPMDVINQIESEFGQEEYEPYGVYFSNLTRDIDVTRKVAIYGMAGTVAVKSLTEDPIVVRWPSDCTHPIYIYSGLYHLALAYLIDATVIDIYIISEDQLKQNTFSHAEIPFLSEGSSSSQPSSSSSSSSDPKRQRTGHKKTLV
jgi:hypothetical protein